MKVLTKYFLLLFFKSLLIRFKYLFFISYVDNKKSITLKNKCLQLNICSYILNASAIRLVFKSCFFNNLASKILVLASNSEEILSLNYNLDFGEDFLFCCLDKIFLNFDVVWYNKL
jgi:hypothetical protein